MPRAKTEPLMVRVDTELLALLDKWRGEQPNPPTRPAALRALAAIGLQVAAAKKRKAEKEKA